MAVIKKRSTPGIYITEKDLSNRVVPAGTSIGGTTIRARKGPINRCILVTNDKEYIDVFGEPMFTSGTSNSDPQTPEMGYGQYAALEFLQESDALYVVRDYDTGDEYASVLYETSGNPATSGIPAASDANQADKADAIYTLDNRSVTGKSLLIGAIGPGTDGNNLAVTVETCHSGCDWFNSYDDYTSATAVSARSVAGEVFKINVYTKTDDENWADLSFSSYSATPVETWYGTRTSKQDAANNQLKIDEVVNGNSDYIYVKPGTIDFDSSSLATAPTSATPLAGGALSIGTNINSSDGWSYFTNREDVTVNILIVPTYNMTVKKAVATIAKNRQDCIVVCQSGQRGHTTVSQIKTAETYGYGDPSYVALYAGWDKYYDKYNDKYVWIPKCIYGAGIMARTDEVANIWDAPMGVNRGIISSIEQYKKFSSTEIGQLYDVNINTSKNMVGYGDVLMGQKTAQMKASKLDRINARRLLLFLETTIETTLVPFIGETNSTDNRLRIYNLLDDFLAGLDGLGAFDNTNGVGYQVVCDSSNNTALVRDMNKLVVDIYVKPVGVIEFIELQMIITRSGVEFSEVIG